MTSAPLHIGRWQSNYSTGYIDELRVTNGEARWTSGFTPPTSAYTSDSNTKLLLHFDGDESDSGHEISLNSNPQMNATTAKFDGAYYFDGTGDYLSIADSDDWNFGDGEFTIDFWMYPTTFSDVDYIMGQRVEPSDGVMFYTDSSGILRVVIGNLPGPGWDITRTADISAKINTWIHVAFVRSVNDWDLYIDGVSADSGTTGSYTISDKGTPWEIGTLSAVDYYTGYLDEIRISKGIARWTENFDVPTEAYTVPGNKISGTKSETARIIVFDESDWSIESNTVVSGSGSYEILNLESGNKSVIARSNDGEVVGYGLVTTAVEE